MFYLYKKTDKGLRFYTGCHYPGFDNEYSFTDSCAFTKHEVAATPFTDDQIDEQGIAIAQAGLTQKRV